MVGAILEVALSYLRPRMFRALFEPVATGIAVSLIAASLVAVGSRYFGGGAGPCIDAPSPFFAKCPNIDAGRAYPWGDARWIGLGFLLVGCCARGYDGPPFREYSRVRVSHCRWNQMDRA